MPNLDLLLRADDQATRRLTEVVNALKQAGVTSLRFGEQAAQGTAVADRAARASASQFDDLRQVISELAPAFIQLGSAAGFLAFMRSAVGAAEEEREALRRLEVQVRAAGQAHLFSEQGVNAWATALQRVTRFSNGEYLQALARAVQKTSDLESAQNLTTLAADLAVSTGRDLAGTLETLALAAGGGQRGLMILRREFPALLKEAQTAGEAIGILARHFGGAAEAEESLTKTSSILLARLSNLKQEVGTALTPALSDLAEGALDVLDAFNKLRGADVAQTIREQIKETERLIAAEASRVPQSLANADTMVEIERDAIARIAELRKRLADLEQKQTDESAERRRKLSKIRTTASDDEERRAAEVMKKQIEVETRFDAIAREASNERIKITKGEAASQIEIVRQNMQDRQSELTRLAQAGRLSAKEFAQAWEDTEFNASANIKRIGEEADATGKFIGEVAQGIKHEFSDAFAESLVAGKNFGDQMDALFEQVMKRVVSRIIEAGIDKLIRGLIAAGATGGASAGAGGGGSFLGGIIGGFFQHGTHRVPGPLGAPRLAVVHGGEQVITPGGAIASTAGMSSGAGGGGVVVNLNLRVADLDPYERQKVVEALIAEIRQSTDVVREFAGELSLLQERTAGRTS